MGVFVPGTAIAAGSPIFSGWMNTITSDINFMGAGAATASGNKDLYQGVQTTAQTFTAGTLVALTFGSEIVDAANGHSTATQTSRYTCQLTAGTGIYMLSGKVAIAPLGTAANTVIGQYYKNGVAIDGSLARFAATQSTATGTEFDMPMFITTMGSGDYVELWATGSVAGTTDVTSSQSSFGVEWLGYKA